MGQKSGKGKYQYDEILRAKPDPEVEKYVQKAWETENIMPGGWHSQVMIIYWAHELIQCLVY